MIKNFLLYMVLLSWCLFARCMEKERPERALSNSDIDEIKFHARVSGHERELLAAVVLKRTGEEIAIPDTKGGILAKFNPKDGDGSVTINFADGPLTMSYAALVLRLKNRDNFEQKPLEYYQQLPSRNGIKIDSPEEQPFITIYHNLADGVGARQHETQGDEEDSLIVKSRRNCWCCSLY